MGGLAGDQYQTSYLQSRQQLQQLLGKAPTTAPDAADPAVQAARQAQILTAQLQQGRKSTMLADGQGVGSTAPVMDKTLLGD